MTLCSTGCISMGGSVAPRSINCELGVPGSSTICLNSPSVRSLAQVPTGAISLCNFYGKTYTPPVFTLDYVVLSGGGGIITPSPCYWGVGSGGGAGGIRCGTIGCCVTCFKNSIPVIVGAGGFQNRGGQSCFGCFMTTCGGGAGGNTPGGGGNPGVPGQSGGSGGGGSYQVAGACAVNNCAEGREGGFTRGSGGGGKCAAGGNGPGGAGGVGVTYCLNQIFGLGPLQGGCYYIAGGGGGGRGPLSNGGLGGGGGGGNYQNPPSYTQLTPAVCGLPGQANTGGGGGGNGGPNCAITYKSSGGSGAVFIRYCDAFNAACVTGGVVGCCVGGYRAFFFCGSGTFCIP